MADSSHAVSSPTAVMKPMPGSAAGAHHHHASPEHLLETFPRLTLNEETLRAAAARSHGGAVKPQGRRRARNARHRTQPVTFTEILEVDETPAPDLAVCGEAGAMPTPTPPPNLDQIKSELTAFSRTMQDARPGSAAGP